MPAAPERRPRCRTGIPLPWPGRPSTCREGRDGTGDCHRLIEQSAALRARSGETHQVSAEIIATSKELAAQTAQLLEVTVSIRADAHGAVPAEVRRARSAPGFWPGLVVRPSGLAASPGSRDLPGGDAAGRSALDARGASLDNARQAGPGTKTPSLLPPHSPRR